MKPYTTPQCIISHLYDKNRNFNIFLLNALLNIVKLLKMMLHLTRTFTILWHGLCLHIFYLCRFQNWSPCIENKISENHSCYLKLVLHTCMSSLYTHFFQAANFLNSNLDMRILKKLIWLLSAKTNKVVTGRKEIVHNCSAALFPIIFIILFM